MAASGTPLLAVRGVEVVYGGAVRALRDVSLTVGQGEVLAAAPIVGPKG
jgi:ABC-type branched-subunit amino acid transport system ATPase component